LAQGLATRGIAVLQYDKRTKVYPTQCANDPNFTMNQETVEDAVKAAASLRTQPEINPARVFVLGHSQGGYMIPRIALADPKLAGVIVLAGNVRSIQELMHEQYAYLGEAEPKSLNLPAAWLADVKDYNPAALAKTITMPMLILQGERDYQVTMKDFELWKASLADRKNVTFRSYPKLNHLFIAGEGKSMPAEYLRPGHVDQQVVEDIAHWIESGK
jgi:dipeptidyl aminopeptidase/acylaminoacyl peptidase